MIYPNEMSEKEFNQKLEKEGFTKKEIERLYFCKSKIEKYRKEIDQLFNKIEKRNK